MSLLRGQEYFPLIDNPMGDFFVIVLYLNQGFTSVRLPLLALDLNGHQSSN